jgi:hypothetical protein
MSYDLRRFLAEQPKSLDVYRNKDIARWVESTYNDAVRHALYSNFDDGREWIVDAVPVPVLVSQYLDKRIHLELLRRQFVMAGWLRTQLLVDEANPMSHVRLTLEGPRDPLIVDTVDYGSVVPEVNPGETIAAAIQRFTQSGVVFYPTIWERVTVLPQGIKRIHQQVVHGDPGGGDS